ncbi:MAG: hypothetical protein Q8L23_11375 [Caulobacter sp.]|nr:hypothetical protein [Caulobacter sp.]
MRDLTEANGDDPRPTPIERREWVTPDFSQIDLSSAQGVGAGETAADIASNT